MPDSNSLTTRYEAWLRANKKHNRPFKRIILELIEKQSGWFSTSILSEVCSEENYPFLAKASYFCRELVAIGLLVRLNHQNHIYYRISEDDATESKTTAPRKSEGAGSESVE